MAAEVRAQVGECADCRHARVQPTARGSAFWRCLRAETDARFVRYPRLPVRACAGFETAPSAGGTGPARSRKPSP
jgi:hypothetical protein